MRVHVVSGDRSMSLRLEIIARYGTLAMAEKCDAPALKNTPLTDVVVRYNHSVASSRFSAYLRRIPENIEKHICCAIFFRDKHFTATGETEPSF